MDGGRQRRARRARRAREGDPAQQQRGPDPGRHGGCAGGGGRWRSERAAAVIARLTLLAVNHRRAVLFGTLLAGLLALIPALDLPLDALPDLTNNQVLVLAAAPGFSPEEMELTVTRPLEVALAGLPGLEEQRSTSRYGIASVTAVFEDG